MHFAGCWWPVAVMLGVVLLLIINGPPGDKVPAGLHGALQRCPRQTLPAPRPAAPSRPQTPLQARAADSHCLV